MTHISLLFRRAVVVAAVSGFMMFSRSDAHAMGQRPPVKLLSNAMIVESQSISSSPDGTTTTGNTKTQSDVRAQGIIVHTSPRHSKIKYTWEPADNVFGPLDRAEMIGDLQRSGNKYTGPVKVVFAPNRDGSKGFAEGTVQLELDKAQGQMVLNLKIISDDGFGNHSTSKSKMYFKLTVK